MSTSGRPLVWCSTPLRQSTAGRSRWKEVLAGEKAFKETGYWLPEETVEAFRDHLIGIKGPLTTPVGGGIRSLNVALRQVLDLYVCLRPVRWFPGVPSPVRHPEKVDMVIFRENTEDVYAGSRGPGGHSRGGPADGVPARRDGMGDPAELGDRHQAHVRDRARSASCARRSNTPSGTAAGASRSCTRGTSRSSPKEPSGAGDTSSFGRSSPTWPCAWEDCGGDPGNKLLVKDTIADITLQQVLTRPDEFDVIATTNLNGDYLSDALAAQVGGIGIAPGGNINYVTGHGVFEATHGTAPKYAGLDKVNPGSVILSGSLMFEHIGWTDVAADIVRALEATIADKIVTYDFARLMDGSAGVKCSEFAGAIVDRL